MCVFLLLNKIRTVKIDREEGNLIDLVTYYIIRIISRILTIFSLENRFKVGVKLHNKI